MKKLIIALAVIALCGCSATQVYKGNKRSQNEIAIIKGMSNWDIAALTMGMTAKVCAVNGIEFSSCQPSIELLPGKYELVLQSAFWGVFPEQRTVTEEFKAGDRYLLGLRQEPTASDVPVLIYKGNVNEDK